MTREQEVAALPPEKKCYCCWHPHGQCPHCPKDLTGAVKVRDRGNDKPSTVCKCNDAPKPVCGACGCTRDADGVCGCNPVDA